VSQPRRLPRLALFSISLTENLYVDLHRSEKG
jgi:hypothetical protein